MKQTRIEATYQVVTPLFCGGASPEDTVEVRMPSFKGVLRFWWRALAWPHFQGDLKSIHENENRLFGSAAGGRSRVSLRLALDPSTPDGRKPKRVAKARVLEDPKTKRVVGEGVRYLGYGLMEAFGSKQKGTREGELLRPCLEAPLQFTVGLTGRDLGEDERALLLRALEAMGLFGGMGARSRRGFGSMVLKTLTVDGETRWQAPSNPSALKDAIRRVWPDARPAGVPDYTAFSKDARCLVVAAEDGSVSALKMLDLLGREFVRYRSWGHKGKVLGEDSERNFKEDHDLMKKSPDARRTHPERVAFGLPHNYGKKPEDKIEPKDFDRRASPLLFHIHMLGEQPVGILTFLPARFLPKGRDRINVGVGRDRRDVPLRDNFYQPVHRFLDRLLTKPKEPLTAMEVQA